MAAENINARNLDAYLRFLSAKTGRDAVPAGGTAVWKAMNDEALADALWAHYEALGIPPNRGTAIARAFMESGEADVVEEEDLPVGQTQPMPMSGGYARTRYHPVDPGITTGNYAQYLHWLSVRTGRALPGGLPAAWAGFNSINIRTSLPDVYAAMELSPDDAQDFEADFIRGVPATSVPPTAQAVPVVPIPQTKPAMPAQAAAPQPNPSSTYQPTPTPTQSFRPAPQQPYMPRPPRRSGRRAVLIVVTLLVLAVVGIGGWVAMKYRTWEALPTVYPLADNIALRTAPSDDAGMAGRLDLFGRYADKVKGVQTSLDRLKLLSAAPENGFYRATPSPSFMDYLTGDDTAVYVAQKYVTDDAASFEEYQRVLAPLRDDLNGLDKLPSAYRRLLVAAFSRSAELRSMNLAVPCRPSAVLSKDAPIPVGTYKSKSTGEITAVFFTSDGKAFTATGVDAEEITTPRVRPVVLDGEAQLTGPGSFKRSGSSTLMYLPCEGENEYPVMGKPPYSAFTTQLPVVIDTVEMAPDVPSEEGTSLLDRILGG